MAAQRFNPNSVKLHRAYSVGELADRLGVHKHTVRHWQCEGLKPIDDNRPTLFQGATVRAFLRNRNANRKRPCPPGTMYCFRCRSPRSPALGMVDYTPFNAVSGNLKAICATCDTIMHRRARQALLATVLPGFEVQITQA
jgi:hypothetical protein